MAKSSDRIREKREKYVRQRKLRRRRLAVFLVPAVAFVIVVIVVLNSGFTLRKVEVTGNKSLSDSKVKALAKVPSEVSMWHLPSGEIITNLRRNPWIEDVRVDRRFWGRTAVIDIDERKPLFIAPDGDSFVLIDDEGMVLETRTDSEVPHPLLQDLPVSPPKPGRRISSSNFKNALACVLSLDSKLRKSINIVSAPSVRGLTLWTRGGVEILYGESTETKKKNFVVKKFLGEPGKVVFIDVSVVSNPSVRRLEEDSSDESREKSSVESKD